MTWGRLHRDSQSGDPQGSDEGDSRNDKNGFVYPGPQSDVDLAGENISSSDLSSLEAEQVQRIVSAGKLDGIWEKLTTPFLPTFTQEPVHEFVRLTFGDFVREKERNYKEKSFLL